MQLPQAMYDEMVAHARAEAPNECCGMIAASDGRAVSVHRARNAARVPKQRYEMHPQDQYDILMAIDDAGNEIGGHTLLVYYLLNLGHLMLLRKSST